MKFTINVECTPEEAREFMGLPDTAEFQKAFFEQMQEQLPENMKPYFKDLPAGMDAWQDFQKMMWAQMMTPMGVNIKPDENK